MKLQGIAPKLLVSERIESKYLPALLNEFSGILSDQQILSPLPLSRLCT